MNALELAGGLPQSAGFAIFAAAMLAGAAGGAFVAARGRRGAVRAATGALYALASGALAVALLAPAAVVTRSDPAKPRVILLVDRSASMGERDGPGGRSRWEAAAALLREGAPFRGELDAEARLQCLAFDERVRPLADEDLDAPPAGRATDIAGAMSAALRTPGVGDLAAVLMIGDGRRTAGLPPEVAAGALAEHRVPLWTIGVGDERATRPRLRILELEVPETATLDQEVAATATVAATNLAGRTLDLRLRVDGEEVARQQLPVAEPSERIPVRFAFRARPEGVRRVELRVLAGQDLSAQAVRHMAVLASPVAILYAEGRLGWGYRAMSDALAAAGGRNVELWNGFLPAETRGRGLDSVLTARIGALDLVVLDSVGAADLGKGATAALARAIREDGCGLLFAGDPECAASFRGTPLEALLPAGLVFEALPASSARSGARVERAADSTDAARAEPLRLSDSEAENHRLWSSLPETRPGWKFGALRNGAEAWLRAGGEPVLVAWRAGAGRVAVMNWPDHWRWARASAEGAEAHRRFFSRLAVWLAGREAARGEKLALSLAGYRLSPGENTSLLARLLQAPPAGPVDVSALVAPLGAASGGPGRDLRLLPVEGGAYRAELRAGPPGEYRAAVAVRSAGTEWARGEAFFSVEGRDAESEDTSPDFAALRAAAGAAGGRFLPIGEAERAPGSLREILPKPAPRLRRVRTELWDRLWLLWTGAASLCGAWIILRRSR